MVGTRAVPRHLRRTSAQAAAAVARPPEVLQWKSLKTTEVEIKISKSKNYYHNLKTLK